jgi:predicted Zn finger-like uncharacterized protein
MLIQCPQCQARYRIDTSGAQKSSTRIRCPKCAHVFPVTIELPTAAPSPPAPLPDQPSSPHSAVKADAVLIVDDSKFFRELIVDILNPLSIACLQAADAEEALVILRQQKPGLILLDLNLPGKSGYELIRLIRADSALHGIRILAMSGVFRKETASAEAEAAGADEFINKSFKPEQLQLRVERWLRG